MFSFQLKSFRSEHQITQPHFFILCKGLNSGKPLSEPCPNCFVCICQSEQEKENLYWILFALWQSRRFHQVLCGSVIPFVRKKELSNLIQIRFDNSKLLSTREDSSVKIIGESFFCPSESLFKSRINWIKSKSWGLGINFR